MVIYGDALNIMSKLCELYKMKFSINYQTIYIGYYGKDFIKPQISKEDIGQYCNELLNKNDDSVEMAIELLNVINYDYDFKDFLEKNFLQGQDNDIEYRKWRVLIVKEALDNLNPDFFEGLVELTEIWITLGIPKDCPNIFQGRDNKITPEEYYTQEMFEQIYKKNREWVENEINEIIVHSN